VLYILALTAVAVYALLQIKLVVIPVLLALILAAAIHPLVAWLRRRGWRGALATGASFVLLILVFTIVVWGVVEAISSQWNSLVSQALDGIDRLYALLRQSPLPVNDEMIRSVRAAATNFMTSSAAGDTALTGLFVATEFVTGFLLMAVVLFFFLKDGGMIWAFCLQPLQGRQRAKARLAGMRSIAVMSGYVGEPPSWPLRTQHSSAPPCLSWGSPWRCL
jgi:predicted PurR-regulated permease PerM